MNRLLTETKLSEAAVLKLIQGDITDEVVDAIVNAANSHLQHGGGVAGAIVRKGGRIIQEESDKIGEVPVGETAITTAGSLPSQFVIHAVGPRWGEGKEEQKLEQAVLSSLVLAEDRGFSSISFPAISAGIFGFPKDRCARVMLTTIRRHFRETAQTSLQEVRLCLYDPPTVQAFKEAFGEIF